MFYVIEMQTNADETGVGTLTTFKTKNEALSKYHTILQYAAISEVPIHAAACLNEDGVLIKRESFDHREEPENNKE